MKYRVKYWAQVNDNFGEWRRTGLMTKSNAEIIADHLKYDHEKVEMYKDEDEA